MASTPPLPVCCPPYQALSFVGIGQVTRGQAVDAQPFGQGLRHGVLSGDSVQVAAQYAGPLTGEHQSATAANATADTGDEGTLPSKRDE